MSRELNEQEREHMIKTYTSLLYINEKLKNEKLKYLENEYLSIMLLRQAEEQLESNCKLLKQSIGCTECKKRHSEECFIDTLDIWILEKEIGKVYAEQITDDMLEDMPL